MRFDRNAFFRPDSVGKRVKSFMIVLNKEAIVLQFDLYYYPHKISSCLDLLFAHAIIVCIFIIRNMLKVCLIVFSRKCDVLLISMSSKVCEINLRRSTVFSIKICWSKFSDLVYTLKKELFFDYRDLFFNYVLSFLCLLVLIQSLWCNSSGSLVLVSNKSF